MALSRTDLSPAVMINREWFCTWWMESFFSLLQKNVLDTRRWKTREELRLAIVTWIETKYNRRRRQRRLGKLSPVAFETIYAAANAA